MDEFKKRLNRLNGWKRLWLVGSTIYIIGALFEVLPILFDYQPYPSIIDRFFNSLFILAFPPASVLAIGYSIAWAIKGFKPPTKT